MQFRSLLALVSLAAAVAAQGSRLVQYSPAPGAIATEWVDALALVSIQNGTLDGLTGVSEDFLAAVRAAKRGPGYLDITESQDDVKSARLSVARVASYTAPNPANYPFLKNTYFGQVQAAKMRTVVDVLSNNFTTRAYRSSNARAPALWIQQQFAASAGSSNVELVENSFNQPNGESNIPVTKHTYAHVLL